MIGTKTLSTKTVLNFRQPVCTKSVHRLHRKLDRHFGQLDISFEFQVALLPGTLTLGKFCPDSNQSSVGVEYIKNFNVHKVDCLYDVSVTFYKTVTYCWS